MKIPTETWLYVDRCRDLFKQFIRGIISLDEFNREMERLKEKPLFKNTEDLRI